MTKKNAEITADTVRATQDTEGLSSLTSEVAALKHALAQRDDDSATRQKAFDTLYEELKQYKEDFIYQNEKSLLLDLLLFYDSLNWFHAGLIKKEMGPEVVADSFQYLLDEMLELLYRRDVLPMEASDAFDRKRQKVIKTVDAESEAEDYAIHHVLKRGFTRGERVLRAEEVVVKRFQTPNGTKT
jgi:molecular chaperone GrpE (heat shock protein)